MAIEAKIEWQGESHVLHSEGSGVLEALNNALNKYLDVKYQILEYQQHALSQSSDSRAISYVAISEPIEHGHMIYHGAGTSSNITKSSLRALVSAYNRSYVLKQNKQQRPHC